MAPQNTLKRIIGVFRCTARVLSGLLLLLFAIFAVAEGVPKPSALTTAEILMFLAVITMFAGLMLAFWREPYGCVLIFSGYAWLNLIDKRFHLSDPFVVFPVVGLLYIGTWLISAAARRALDSTT